MVLKGGFFMKRKTSYDYSDLISELSEELSDGILSLDDTIQILRADEEITRYYRPIIDWYYSDERMVSHPDKVQYEHDKPKLISITVVDCLNEMERWNALI